ncbi:phosphotransferase family protein [Trichoderma austrokoningii]
MAPSFEEFDDDAWDYGDELFQAWMEKLQDEDLYYDIVAKIKEHQMGGDVVKAYAPQKGSFNVYYRVRFHMDEAMIRFPIPAYFKDAEEKLTAEFAAMRYMSKHATIPLPFVYHHGTKEESPRELGPFLVMEWVENSGDCVDVVNTPGLAVEDVPVLDPNVDEHKLEDLYGQLADVLLQLSKCKFPLIGSLGFRDGQDDSEPEVLQRPLSLNLSQMANLARVPHFELPPISTTFKTSSEYYSALADMHLQQLSFQRNNAIDSPDDCRKKYIARQLFRKLAADNRLAEQEFEHGPFPLWCDDFRPANVLVDENDKVVAAIDWEFTYAAPAEFSLSPPWWLLLKAPDDWEAGLDDWVANYEPRLEVFLRALERKEKDFMAQGRLEESEILSSRMRKSWESGHFWVTYAARRSWAFDGIFWKFLDPMFFGKNESGSFEERVKLLPPEQISAMEAFVKRKVQEKEEHTLVDWYEPGAEEKLPPDVLGP